MTLQEFANWSLGRGSVAKTDGGFKGECVSLINQKLAKVDGIAAGAWGDAWAWGKPDNPNVSQYFDQVANVQDGDIIVYPQGWGGSSVGHIGIAFQGKLLNQNYDTPKGQTGTVKLTSLFPGYSAVLRRKGAVAPTQGEDMPTLAKIEDVQKIAYVMQGIAPDAPQLQLWVGRDIRYVLEDFWNMDNTAQYLKRIQDALRGGAQYEEVVGPVFKKKEQ